MNRYLVTSNTCNYEGAEGLLKYGEVELVSSLYDIYLLITDADIDEIRSLAHTVSVKEEDVAELI